MFGSPQSSARPAWSGSPLTTIFILNPFLLGFAGLAACLLGLGVMELSWGMAAGGGAIVAAYALLVADWHLTVYRLEGDRMVHEHGVGIRIRREVELADVTEILVSRGPLEAIFDRATVQLKLHGQDRPVTISAVEGAADLAARIRTANGASSRRRA